MTDGVKYILGPIMYFHIQNGQLWFFGGDNVNYLLDGINKEEFIAWLQENMKDDEQAATAG